MRLLRGFLIVGVLFAFVPTLRAQDASAAATGGSLFALLVGGDATGPGATSSHFAWASDSTVAVSISQALVTGADPMSPGWVKLALGGQPRSITPGTYDPAAVYDLKNSSLLIYGGNVPANWTSPTTGIELQFPDTTRIPPVTHDDSATVPVRAEDLPILGVQVRLPTDEAFGLATVTLANPDGTIYASRTVSFPEGGWWALKIEGPTLDDPTDEVPPTDPPPTAVTPEPGTLAIAAFGMLGVMGWRLRRTVSGVSKKRL